MSKKILSCLILFCFVFSLVSVYADSAAATANPAREWKLDEGDGDIVSDTSGQGKHGLKTGAEWIQGIKGNALNFAGSVEYVKVPPIMYGNLKNWTFSAFVKPTGTGEICVYSEKNADSPEEDKRYFYISITEDDRIKVAAWSSFRDVNWDITQTKPGVIKRGEWNHLHVTLKDGKETAKSGQIEFYVNRILVDSDFLGTAFLSQGIVGAAYTVGTQQLERLADGRRQEPGTDFDKFYPWSEMKPVNWGGVSMIKIPKFYYKRTYSYDGSKNKWVHTFMVTDKPTVGFKIHPAFVRNDIVKPYVLVATGKFGRIQTRDWCRNNAKAKGDGWGIVDIQTWSAIQMLWLIEYANTNSQSVLSSANYRGITGLYTSPAQWIDGINLSDRKVYIAESNFVENKFDGQYQFTGFTLPTSNNSTNNWTYSADVDWLFLPSAGGSGIPDRFRIENGAWAACAGYVRDRCGCGCSSCKGDHGTCTNISMICNNSKPVHGLFSWDMSGVYEKDYVKSSIGGRYLYIP